jgi:hypothetical protein
MPARPNPSAEIVLRRVAGTEQEARQGYKAFASSSAMSWLERLEISYRQKAEEGWVAGVGPINQCCPRQLYRRVIY